MAYIGNTQLNQNYVPAIDYFSGNGSTTAFTLSRPVASVAQVQAVIENVPQNPGDAYTVSGNTITFTSAPPSGTNNIYIYYTSPNTQVTALPQSPVVYGNLNFGSTGARIQGDFSNATVANRVYFQTSTTNGITAVAAIPNGTGTSSFFAVFPNSNPSNTGYGYIASSATEVTFRSVISGTGTYLPMTFYTGGSERMRIDTSGNVGIGVSSPSVPLDVSTTTGRIWFRKGADTGGTADGNGIQSVNSDATDNAALNIRASVITAITGSTERMRIDSGGNVLVGGGTTATGAMTLGRGGAAGGCIQVFNKPNSGATNVILNYFGATYVGGMNMDNTSTQFLTSSDYRLKQNVTPMAGALEKVVQLNPVTWSWKSDDSNGQGFIAHELQEHFPDAVSGTKDAIDDEGNPVYQGVDTSFLVATLTKAIQELKAIVDEQAEKIKALEAK